MIYLQLDFFLLSWIAKEVFLICEFCNKQFKNHIALRVHRGRAHFELIESVCQFCDKKFQHSKRKNQIYCTVKCKYKHQKDLYSGAGNPAYKGGAIEKKCEYCNSIFHADRANSRRYSRFCSKSCFSKNLWATNGLVSYVFNGVRYKTLSQASYAEWLTRYNLTWFFKPKTFYLHKSEGLHYTPTFYISEWNMFVDTPRVMTKEHQLKIKIFQEKYPFYELKVFLPEELFEITKE